LLLLDLFLLIMTLYQINFSNQFIENYFQNFDFIKKYWMKFEIDIKKTVWDIK